MTAKTTKLLLVGLLCLALRPAHALGAPVHECDDLAAHPDDSQKVAPGVEWESLDSDLALPACKAAVRMRPDVSRFKFQYARVLNKAGDYDSAIRLYRELAEHGYAAAQYGLGHMHYEGRGVSQDYVRAVKWYRKAAEQRYAGAQYMLGVMYITGRGVPWNLGEALSWLFFASLSNLEHMQHQEPGMMVLLVVSAVVPALLLMWYFWSRDAYPEPPRVVWTTFALGMFSIVVVLPLEVPIAAVFEAVSNPWAAGLGTAFLAVAIPEDLAKFCILFFFCLRHAKFDGPMDGLVYGAAASMGFAALENLFHVYEGGLGVAAIRAVTAVPSHAMHGAIMGYFLALYHFLPAQRGLHLFQALAIPVFLHGLYDFPLLTAQLLPEDGLRTIILMLGFFAVVSVALGFALALFKRVREVQRRQMKSAETEPNLDLLAVYHGRGAPAWSLKPWLILLFSGMLAGVGTTLAIQAAIGGVEPVSMAIGLLLAVLGIQSFRKGTGGLNWEPPPMARP